MPNLDPFLDNLLSIAAGTKFVAKDGAALAGYHTIEQLVTHMGTTYAVIAHSHVIADTAGLQAALDAKAAVAHSHIIGDVTGLQAALDGKALTSHTHILTAVTDVTMTVANLNLLDDGLDTALHFHAADRARATHTGTQLSTTISDFSAAADARIAAAVIDALSDVVITTPSNGQVLKYNGSAWVNGTDATGAGAAWTAAIITLPAGMGAFEARTTIVSAGVTTSSVILTKLAPALDTDENDPEFLSLDTLIALPGTGAFEILITFRELTSGPIKLQYQIAA